MVVTVVSVVLAYPFAWILAEHVPARWQRLALMLAVLPFWTSYVVRSYSWLLVLAQNGVINKALIGSGLIAEPVQLANTRFATVVGFVHFFVMLLTLTIFANLKQLSPSYRKAAADLGAGPVRTFLHVVLPLTLARHHGRRFPDLRALYRRLHHPTDPRRQQRASDAAAHHDADRQAGRLPARFGAVDHPDGSGHGRISGLRALAEDRSSLIWRAVLKIASVLYALAVYGFIFLPVAVLVLFSLQSTAFPIPPFNGPSLRWFAAVLGDARLTSALVNSVVVALLSSLAAAAFGFPRGLGICAFRIARLGFSAWLDHAAADGELSDHRHGSAGAVQCRRRA